MMRKTDLEEYGFDPDVCCRCGSEDEIQTCKYGLPWCENHRHRGQLLDWGMRHLWPDLKCSPYAIGHGEYCWYFAVMMGIDALIQAALAAIELAGRPVESPTESPEPVGLPVIEDQSMGTCDADDLPDLDPGEYKDALNFCSVCSAMGQKQIVKDFREVNGIWLGFCSEHLPPEISAPSSIVQVPAPVPTTTTLDQDIDRMRKEARRLKSLLGDFIHSNNHQMVEWESSGRMHPNGRISEKEYHARVVNALRVGERETLKDVIEAMQRTLQKKEVQI